MGLFLFPFLFDPFPRRLGHVPVHRRRFGHGVRFSHRHFRIECFFCRRRALAHVLFHHARLAVHRRASSRRALARAHRVGAFAQAFAQRLRHHHALSRAERSHERHLSHFSSFPIDLVPLRRPIVPRRRVRARRPAARAARRALRARALVLFIRHPVLFTPLQHLVRHHRSRRFDVHERALDERQFSRREKGVFGRPGRICPGDESVAVAGVVAVVVVVARVANVVDVVSQRGKHRGE